MTHSGTRITTRPSLAVALVRAWRMWHEQDPLLVTGPADADRTADDDRARADRRAARPTRETPPSRGVMDPQRGSE